MILISPKNRTTYNFRGELLKEFISKGYEVIVTGPNVDGVEHIKALGVRLEVVELKKNGLNFLSDLKYMFALRKLLLKEKPDLILSYTIKPVIYGSIAAKFARVKNINSMITGLGYVFTAKTLKSKILKTFVSVLYKLSLSCSDRVIFQNEDDLNELIRLNIVNKDKCKLVNGSGVNMEKFSRQAFPVKTTFFMLSRLMYSKGVLEYLQASRKVKKKHPHVRFMLLGALENIQDSIMKKELDTYLNDGTIEYFEETNDVIEYYKMCSVYVLPSYREGTPRTVLEAMSVGRPVITTDAPGCRQTVQDGINGYLVPIANSTMLAQKMESFIQNQSQIKSMGEESYRICKEKYDVHKVNKTMLKHMNV